MVNKITSPITPLEEVAKINEVIDAIPTETTVSGWGFTKNAGTVTSVNNVSPVNGNVSLTIPTVNNATLTITQGGTTKGTFTANASSNVTIDLDAGGGSGASRNIGEIITSTIPLTDAGLHLLDGSVISGSGSYSAFVTYIAGLVSSYPDLFETEANWQSSVSTYGVCGKFVYDSVNGTVRLPKITGFTEGTIDPTTLGDLTQAGLPNITYTDTDRSQYNVTTTTGALSKTSYSSTMYNVNVTGNCAIKSFDASLSNSIYGNSNTVQPQSIKVLYYIVIATSTKTQIEVDIDEVMTDLNGKVSTADLATCHVVVETYVNGSSWYRVYDDGWVEQGGINSIPSTNTATQITLLKEFKDTNYIVVGTANPTSIQWANMVNAQVTSKSTSSFYVSDNVNNNNWNWQACGYIR